MRVQRQLPLYEAGAIDVPFVIDGFEEVVREHTEWAEHSHPTHELIWHQRGASTVTVGARTWTITPTSGLWMPAGVRHSGLMAAGTWYRTAHFGVSAVASISTTPVAVEITPLLRLLLERLSEPGLTDTSRSATEALVLDLLEPSANEIVIHVPDAPLLEPIVRAVRADPGDTRTLAEWARELRVNPRTISRAFRSETGMAFSRWVGTVRAQRAVELLAHGADIEDVASLTGYSSVSAFGAAFRRTTGSTPGVFRPRGSGRVSSATGDVLLA